MARIPKLTFDRGTLLLHPPPRGKSWLDFATWDERVERFRIPAFRYRQLIEAMKTEGTPFNDEARRFETLDLASNFQITPYPHQLQALEEWKRAGRCGVVVLPTASGKTYLAQLALESTPRSTLICVPTLDLMHQWYAHLKTAFPETQVGLLGGGSHDRTHLLIATYTSAAIHAESLGAAYGLLIFDECHHLPSDFHRTIAEFSLAPYRLGLSATPERLDGRHEDLATLIGAEVFHRTPEQLRGTALAEHRIEHIKVHLSADERRRYDELISVRNTYLRDANIHLGSRDGWSNFVRGSAQSRTGRRAMLAHREARRVATGTASKLRVLVNLLAQHPFEPTLIFTDDNATVYRISQDLLIPALTHQTPIKERHETLKLFREGTYKTIVASHVLNEGVDVPEASVAIILSGTGSAREFVQRLGRVLRRGTSPDKRAVLYELVAHDTTEEGTSARRKKKPTRKVAPANAKANASTPLALFHEMDY
jgi:superfamily II DNA or RNA helicase